MLDLDLAWSGPGFTLDQRRQRLQFYIGLAQWDDTGRMYGLRAIALRETRQLIGACGFHPDVWSARWKAASWPILFNDTVTIGTHASMELGRGYGLAQPARRQGYATEAVEALLAHAFQTLQIGRVSAVTERGNDASVGVMHRVGMRTAQNPDSLIDYPGVVGVVENANHAPEG